MQNAIGNIALSSEQAEFVDFVKFLKSYEFRDYLIHFEYHSTANTRKNSG